MKQQNNREMPWKLLFFLTLLVFILILFAINYRNEKVNSEICLPKERGMAFPIDGGNIVVARLDARNERDLKVISELNNYFGVKSWTGLP